MADFGCGDAKIAQSVPNKVHSFDLVALNQFVTPCDMAHVSSFILRPPAYFLALLGCQMEYP